MDPSVLMKKWKTSLIISKPLARQTYLSGCLEGPSEGTESDIDAVLGLGGNTDIGRCAL